MSKPIAIDTSEKIDVTIRTSSDPTGALPEFAVGEGTSPSGFVAGSWAGAWDATSGEIQAVTPLVGLGQVLDLTQRGTWRLWAKWTVDLEDPVRLVEVYQVV